MVILEKQRWAVLKELRLAQADELPVRPLMVLIEHSGGELAIPTEELVRSAGESEIWDGFRTELQEGSNSFPLLPGPQAICEDGKTGGS